uniref:Uncharacterized protein n=1 Tax=Arundo donax TaxID=35708 RepID=A0A0A8Z6D1_ARUDO
MNRCKWNLDTDNQIVMFLPRKSPR